MTFQGVVCCEFCCEFLTTPRLIFGLDVTTPMPDLLPHCRHALLDGVHLIWEDAAEAYSAHLAQWVQKEYHSV